MVEAHPADDLELADVDPRLEIGGEIGLLGVLVVLIGVGRDRGEGEAGRAAGQRPQIIDETPQSAFAEGREAGSGQSDPRQVRWRELQAQSRNRNAAADLAAREVALELGSFIEAAQLDIVQPAAARGPARAAACGVPVIAALGVVELAAGVLDDEGGRVVDQGPALAAQQRQGNAAAAARPETGVNDAGLGIDRFRQEKAGAGVGVGHAQLQAEAGRAPLRAVRIAGQVVEFERAQGGAAVQAEGVGDLPDVAIIGVVLRARDACVSGAQVQHQLRVRLSRQDDILGAGRKGVRQGEEVGARLGVLIIEFQIGVAADPPFRRQRPGQGLGLVVDRSW